MEIFLAFGLVKFALVGNIFPTQNPLVAFEPACGLMRRTANDFENFTFAAKI